jgi:hypothetical protein
VNRNGEPKVAYGGNLLMPASIDHQGRSLVSTTVQTDSVSVVITRGDPDATLVVLSDLRGNSVRALSARCDGAAY